jgi:hypothetical protein
MKAKCSSVLLLASLIGVSVSCQADATQGIDAPTWVWKTPSWNLDRDLTGIPRGNVESKFGNSTKWQTGDGICGRRNCGYQYQVNGEICYLDFYDGEQGEGIHLTNLPERAAELGFSDCSDNPHIQADILKLPKVPFLPLGSKFVPPIPLGTRKNRLLNRLNTHSNFEKDRDIEFYRFRWEAHKRIDRERNRLFGGNPADFWDVQTILKLGFKNGKLVYYDVDRFWQD